MNCARCGEQGVTVGAPCPTCGADAVAPDVLDSLLSMPAAPVPEAPEDDPDDFAPLAVEPGTVGPTTAVDPAAAPDPSVWQDDTDADQPRSVPSGPAMFVDPTSIDEPGLPPSPATLPGAAPLLWDDEDEVEPVTSPEPSAPVVASGPPLPQRVPLDETAAQWGSREHPPAVMAPPPPHPLDAPVVERVKRTTGTGLPAGMLVSSVVAPPLDAPASPPAPGGATTPPAPAGPAESGDGSGGSPNPERQPHPRVRRWFGRGTGPDPDAGTEVEPAAQELPVAEDGPFPGAPEGLLEGVLPEPDLGDAVNDPAGVEAAMSRLSAGARRAVLAPLAVVTALLENGEVAEAVVQGEYQHRPGVVVLTDRRVLVANDRRWAPDVRTLPLDPALVVHGWQDDRRATLVFVLDGIGVLVGAISDRPLARDLAQRVRARVGGGPPGGSPPV